MKAYAEEKNDKAPYKELEIFARVMHFIDENYVWIGLYFLSFKMLSPT